MRITPSRSPDRASRRGRYRRPSWRPSRSRLPPRHPSGLCRRGERTISHTPRELVARPGLPVSSRENDCRCDHGRYQRRPEEARAFVSARHRPAGTTCGVAARLRAIVASGSSGILVDPPPSAAGRRQRAHRRSGGARSDPWPSPERPPRRSRARARPSLAHHGGRVLDMRPNHRDVLVADKGRRLHERLVKTTTTQRVDVRPPVHRFSPDLLGGDVGDRSDEAPRQREPTRRSTALHEPEVGQIDVVGALCVADQHISGLTSR